MNFVEVEDKNSVDITSEQAEYVKSYVERLVRSGVKGFNIIGVKLPKELKTVSCGLYGPTMDDGPIPRKEVTMDYGNSPEWKDPMINRPLRQVREVTFVGKLGEKEVVIYSIYGGPISPQNPEDPENRDVEESIKFWKVHALAYGD